MNYHYQQVLIFYKKSAVIRALTPRWRCHCWLIFPCQLRKTSEQRFARVDVHVCPQNRCFFGQFIVLLTLEMMCEREFPPACVWVYYNIQNVKEQHQGEVEGQSNEKERKHL